jgi:hypothetical protein
MSSDPTKPSGVAARHKRALALPDDLSPERIVRIDLHVPRRPTQQEVDEVAWPVSGQLEAAMLGGSEAIAALIDISPRFRPPQEITQEWATAAADRLSLIELAMLFVEWLAITDAGEKVILPAQHRGVVDLLLVGGVETKLREAIGTRIIVHVSTGITRQ